MALTWQLELRGGAHDGWTGAFEGDPQEILIAWECRPLCSPGCAGHATFDPHCPAIVLATAESYKRTDVDLDSLLAVYEVGDGDPDGQVEIEELVPVGAGAADLGHGWPVSR